METKFNFKSQVCTSIVQSRRLLELGLKKETADMVYRSYGYIIDEFGDKERIFKQPTMVVDGWESKHDIPAWSLHRLIVLNLDTDLPSAYEGIEGQKNIYDEVIDYAELLIREGYFNKEYLEE